MGGRLLCFRSNGKPYTPSFAGFSRQRLCRCNNPVTHSIVLQNPRMVTSKNRIIMKSTVKNNIIGVIILAAIIAVVWLLPPKPLFAILIVLQIFTLLAIGGTNININANGNRADVNDNDNLNNQADHE